MRVILASESPRRKELLDLMKIEHEVLVSEVDETFIPNISIYEQSKRLSYTKAKSVFDKTSGDRVVIGADTIVVKNNKIYGKPKSEEDAIKILEELKNSKHEVITSLAILIQDKNNYQEFIDYDSTNIYLKDISDEEILNWVNTNNALDKAGGYGLQTEFCVFVDRIEGNYTTVVGLPTHKLYDIIKKYMTKGN